MVAARSETSHGPTPEGGQRTRDSLAGVSRVEAAPGPPLGITGQLDVLSHALHMALYWPVLDEVLRRRGTGLQELNLGGGDVNTHAPMALLVFTVMAVRRKGNAKSTAGGSPTRLPSAEPPAS